MHKSCSDRFEHTCEGADVVAGAEGSLLLLDATSGSVGIPERDSSAMRLTKTAGTGWLLLARDGAA